MLNVSYSVRTFLDEGYHKYSARVSLVAFSPTAQTAAGYNTERRKGEKQDITQTGERGKSRETVTGRTL